MSEKDGGRRGRTVLSDRKGKVTGVWYRLSGLSEDQFREWVNRGSDLPLAVNGHTFVLKGNNTIMVDGGKFLYEEALELVKLLNSKNPFDQINAGLMIAERNGALRIVVLALIAAIIVISILLALH